VFRPSNSSFFNTTQVSRNALLKLKEIQESLLLVGFNLTTSHIPRTCPKTPCSGVLRDVLTASGKCCTSSKLSVVMSIIMFTSRPPSARRLARWPFDEANLHKCRSLLNYSASGAKRSVGLRFIDGQLSKTTRASASSASHVVTTILLQYTNHNV